jgi:uncharacterized DUF497 family protein
MRIYSWAESNTTHIAKHGVTQAEAQDVVERARAPYPEYIGTGKWRVIGKTGLGRWLQVIFVYSEDEQVELDSLSISDLPFFMSGEAQVVCVIHSRELTHAEKKRSRKRRKE